MENSKSAILIYGENKVQMAFTYYKRYDIGTGYVALYEKTKRCCVLCRILEIREISSFACHNLILNGEYAEQPVIVINSNLTSVEEADTVIRRYMNTFQTYQNKK